MRGVRELGGRLLVRPLQGDQWQARGLDSAGAGAAQARAAARIAGAELFRIDAADIHVLAVPPGQTEGSYAAMLMSTGDYEYPEPDWVVYPCDTTPDDPGYVFAWQLQKIQAYGAWERTTGDGSFVCAFVDTGVDLTHPDLAANLVPGYNAASQLTQAQGGEVSDVNGHGTSVAGVAAAIGNNFQGASGVGWDLKIMPVRCSNWSSGSAFLGDVLWGAVWASFNGARVINVSYAGVDSSSAQATGQAIREQYGGLLFWAAGNNNQELTGDWPDVIIVGSTDVSDVRASDSNWGAAIDVVAPGVGVYAPTRGGGYGWVSGTSYASPIAAATAALGWSLNPALTPTQVMNNLFASCIDLGDPGDDAIYGHGRVNAYRMVSLCDPNQFSENGEGVLPAIQVTDGPVHTGLVASYYQLPHHLSPPWNFSTLTPYGAGVAQSLIVPQAASQTGIGVDYNGYIWVPTTAPYTFTVQATDGACLWIDRHPAAWITDQSAGGVRAGTLRLAAGWHQVWCAVYSQVGIPSLAVRMRGAGMGSWPVGSPLLFHGGALPTR